MKVLDATFLIDYLADKNNAREFVDNHGGTGADWVMPTPAYAEVLVGVGNGPEGNLDAARETLDWGEVVGVDERLANMAAEIAEDIQPGGPYLAGMDGVILAVGRDLSAPVVSRDNDMTHEKTKEVVDVEEYAE
ncbi:PIN domain-containing protein [Halocalculus aciditolerans]|uniref:PIN domain-containing protein n=1 Tax=Halocalculus aciditolerans TaxID=1383812 RepID=A0A830FB99_9EURY|nr:PIN domain-containing protein [Halocalculus aciditolerans]GGL57992.1 hypothetical protein GCM10009039_15240 [Halocalculus aciditolerans]